MVETDVISKSIPTIIDENCVEMKKENCVERCYTLNRLLFVFFCMNLLNYIERVVISGASQEVIEFTKQSVSTNVNTYFGALTSAYIGGFSIASLIFGYYVTKYPPFKIVSIGLFIWLLAALGSGLAPNYWVLLISRLISGVGEAAFQIVIPAYINDVAPRDKVGSAMAVLYSAISVGTAIGFTASGWVSEHFSWRLMFLAVSPFMIPSMIILYFVPYHHPVEEEKTSFIKSSFKLLTPSFVCAFLAEAAGVFICAAYTAFGNELLINLGLFKTVSASTLAFGVVCCVAGIIGSLLGGYTLNRMKVNDSFTSARLTVSYSTHLGCFAIIAVFFFLICAFTYMYRIVFIGSFFFGFCAIFASNPSWTLVILNTATPLLRPMALGVATIFYHICGDVPAPIISGRFLDFWLKRAGGDSHQKYLSYVYMNWFILSQIIVMVLWCSLVFVFARIRLNKENKLQRK